MLAERLKEIVAEHPWLPDDCLRVWARVQPGLRRYGLEWFDGPQRPQDAFGPTAAASFPSAIWIGRRQGRFVGYEGVERGRPVLCEWGGSERRVIRRFAGMDELILSQLNPSADGRPVVRHELNIPGMAFGPWRDAGQGLTADCILSPGLEGIGLDNLLGRLAAGWELLLGCGDNESGLSVRKHHGQFELLNGTHGSMGDWRAATRESAYAELLALAPYNDGALKYFFGRIDVPKPV